MLGHCFLTILFTQGCLHLNITDLIAPVTLSKVHTDASDEAVVQGLTNLGRNASRTEKIRHVNCTVGLISAPMQFYTSFGAEVELFFQKKEGILHFPDLLILLTSAIDTDNKADASRVFQGKIVTFLRANALNAPPTYLITQKGVRSSSRGQNERHNYWQLCWSCGFGFEITPMSEQSCSLEKLMNLSNVDVTPSMKIKWTLATIEGDDLVTEDDGDEEIRQFCPFTLKQDQPCNLPELQRTFQAIVTPLNSTARYEDVLDGLPIPGISFGKIWKLRHPIDVELTEHDGDFKFITSDSVGELNAAEFNNILGPFQQDMWISVVLAALLLTAALTLSQQLALRRKRVGSNLLAVMGVLLDQYTSPPQMNRRIPRKIVAVMMTLWMISGLIINNSFKGQVQSNSIVEKEYGTKWTNLLQLTDFKLIFAYSPAHSSLLKNCSEIEDFLGIRLHDTINADGGIGFHTSGFWTSPESVIDSKTRSTFALYHEKSVLENACIGANRACDAKYHSWVTERIESLELLLKRAYAICDDRLEAFMRDDLTKSGTAFFTTKALFPIDWQRFQNFMAESTQHVRFAHNYAVEDTSFRTFKGYHITGRLLGPHKERVLKRMRGLMSSGISCLWKQWDQHRKIFNLPKTFQSNDPVPLAMSDANIQLTFALLFTFNFIAFLAFAMEIMWKLLLTWSEAVAMSVADVFFSEFMM